MPWFRANQIEDGRPITTAGVEQVLADALNIRNFFVADPSYYSWVSFEEATCWEVFRGQALDHTQTRARSTFSTWCVWDETDHGNPPEPFLALRWDRRRDEIHVTRSIRCHAWQSAGVGNVVHAQEAICRVRELVGTICLANVHSIAELRDELIALLFHAVTGTCRLPLTSLEAPLPEFSLGALAYGYRDAQVDAPDLADWLACLPRREMGPDEESRCLEFALRSVPRDDLRLLLDWTGAGRPVVSLFQEMFNSVALTPYTDFADNALCFLSLLRTGGRITPENEADVLTHLLRQIGRHLTSFNLVEFHHRGANYPDALLLEAILERLFERIEQWPGVFLAKPNDAEATNKSKRLRRRGLRQAWLIVREYAGRLVPDWPTSPGENRRVLPASHPRVADEQILQDRQRTRRLFDRGYHWPNAAMAVLHQAIADLSHPVEQRELGVGLFLNRPFGIFKRPGEPDRTTLLSHVAYSRAIALQRLKLLSEVASAPVDLSEVCGVRWSSPHADRRPGVASLADAEMGGRIFIWLTTTRRTVRELKNTYAWCLEGIDGLGNALEQSNCLILPAEDDPTVLHVFDSTHQLGVSLRLDSSAGYTNRAGREWLSAGFRISRM